MRQSDASQPAGLTARCNAAALDISLVYLLTFGIVWLGRLSDRYVSYELTFLLAWVALVVLLTAWAHRTPGKWLLGLAVQRAQGGPPGVLHVVLRETAARFVALAPLGLGVGAADHALGDSVVEDAA